MPESRILVVDSDPQRAGTTATVLQFIDYVPVAVEDVTQIKVGEHRPQDWLAVMLGDIPDWSRAAQFIDWLKRDRCHPPILVRNSEYEKALDGFGLDRSACFAVDYPVRYA